MEANRIRPEDFLIVDVLYPDGRHRSVGVTGAHDVASAVERASQSVGVRQAGDCVFRVVNKTTGVTSEYRVNAHGHVRLIV